MTFDPKIPPRDACVVGPLLDRWARERPEIGVLVLEDHGGRVRSRWSPGLEAFLVQDSTLVGGG